MQNFYTRRYKCTVFIFVFNQEELKTPDEGEHTTQGADKMSEASALWTEVSVSML